MGKTHLLIIDPQLDFCALDGSLCVPGAMDDMHRLAQFLGKNISTIDEIFVSLDLHHFHDIAHPSFWINQEGKHPDPFTIITHDDVLNGVWRTSTIVHSARATEYLKRLKENNRYPLCIWPPHCLIGSKGSAIVDRLLEKLHLWERKRCKSVGYIMKGMNPFTEHYSAMVADVPDVDDESTQFNEKLITNLEQADIVLVAGEASSHCVANTVTDILDYADEWAENIVLLTDAMSPVPSFEGLRDKFVAEATKRGVRTAETTSWM